MFVTACGNQVYKNTDINAVAAEAENAVTNSENGNSTNKNDTSVISLAADIETIIDSSKLFSNRDLSGEYDAAKCDNITISDKGCTTDSKNVTIDGSTVTIMGEGDYIVSGTLSDGMIIVDVDKSEKVQLVLNGVDITSETSAAIYVKKADKVFVTLADGTENALTNGGTFVAIDDNNIDAVIFSKDDLTLNGTGTLIINSPADHGIVSKNELVITNGTYQITAASHGMTGKDNIAIADGSFVITAGKDAIQSQNEDDDTLGFVYIANGSFLLNAESDGINAINEINIAGGTITVEKSEEGLEARLINISGGEIDITSSDDGLNATDKRSSAVSSEAVFDMNTSMGNMSDKHTADRKSDSSSDKNTDEKKKDFQGGRGGFGGMGDTHNDANIHISGGVVRINAEGDGVDSNGYLTVSGGELYVTGPSNGGNGALDYGIDAAINGGIVVAAGQSGMAQNFGSESTQGTILVNTQQQNAAGSDIVLLDSEGSELIAWTAEKAYNSVVVSCPEIRSGSSYIVKTGDVSTEVTMDSLVYGDGFGFGGGRHDFQGGGRPEGKPDFQNGGRSERMQQPPGFENGGRPEGMPEPPEFGNGERPEGAVKQ
ncbi:MAG: carbohydrate-binding domain-containing protein [Lachnospiraceae bacterium]|nr:carbohydrate-binding domain-containing protein [Lachnospiraceae bacterium]